MAKGNLFLGMAKGSVGDVVYSRQYGVQVSRARNRWPKNPQTPLQLLQRVVMKTTSSAYAYLQEICNHSFQGYAEGTRCQSRFAQLNVAMLREKLADEINLGDPTAILTSSKANYLPKDGGGCEMMPWIVSEGTLPPIEVTWQQQTSGTGFIVQTPIASGLPSSQIPTYAQVIEMFGAERGDQLTFLWMTVNDAIDIGRYSGFYYARVILDPANGDLSQPFVSSVGNILQPNERNEGNVTLKWLGNVYWAMESDRVDGDADAFNSSAAATVIHSRLNTRGNTWLRSTQQLVLRGDSNTGGDSPLSQNHLTDLLGDAVQSYLTEENSTLYLNQATRSF